MHSHHLEQRLPLGSVTPSPRRASCGARTAASVLATLVVMGCTRDGTVGNDTNRPTTVVRAAAQPAVGDGDRIEVTSLGVSFGLPASFVIVESPEMVFLARSSRPPAILSIAEESREIVQHETERGETVSSMPIDGATAATVITNAAVEGLPAAVVANELLVANGPRSFSLILSARASAIEPMWNGLLASLEIA